MAVDGLLCCTSTNYDTFGIYQVIEMRYNSRIWQRVRRSAVTYKVPIHFNNRQLKWSKNLCFSTHDRSEYLNEFLTLIGFNESREAHSISVLHLLHLASDALYYHILWCCSSKEVDLGGSQVLLSVIRCMVVNILFVRSNTTKYGIL